MVLKIFVIIFGVALASAGEVQFSWLGFSFQLGGLIFESVRVVMIEVLVGSVKKMDPLVSLYYFAPVCAVSNLGVAFFTEWPTFQWEDVNRAGVWTLVLNASVAFLLNVSSVLLVSHWTLTPKITVTLTIAASDWQDIWLGPSSHGHTEEHSSGRSVGIPVAYQHHAPSDSGLHGSGPRFCALQIELVGAVGRCIWYACHCEIKGVEDSRPLVRLDKIYMPKAIETWFMKDICWI
jgi:hypothetical protein